MNLSSSKWISTFATKIAEQVVSPRLVERWVIQAYSITMREKHRRGENLAARMYAARKIELYLAELMPPKSDMAGVVRSGAGLREHNVCIWDVASAAIGAMQRKPTLPRPDPSTSCGHLATSAKAVAYAAENLLSYYYLNDIAFKLPSVGSAGRDTTILSSTDSWEIWEPKRLQVFYSSMSRKISCNAAEAGEDCCVGAAVEELGSYRSFILSMA